jgi:hypothetical protein
MPFGIINNYYNNRAYRNQLNALSSSISHSRRGGGDPRAANSSRRRSGSMRNWRKKMNCAGCSGETVQIIKNVDKCCSKNIKHKRRKNFIDNAHRQDYHFSSNSYLKRRGKTYEKNVPRYVGCSGEYFSGSHCDISFNACAAHECADGTTVDRRGHQVYYRKPADMSTSSRRDQIKRETICCVKKSIRKAPLTLAEKLRKSAGNCRRLRGKNRWINCSNN